MNNRFQRHYLIPDWNQEQLTQSHVIVVGMGALGNEVARILAMSGVGNLVICDPDRIEESNLSRTVLFGQTDIGRLKVDAAADSLINLFPGIVVKKRPRPLVHGIGLGELRDASLVLGCLDSRSARLQLAGRCQLIKAAYIDGGTHPWGGEVRPYLDPEGPCFGCSLSEEERAVTDVPWSCLDKVQENPTGSAVPSSALVGTWMGMIAVRFLMGLDCPPGTLRIDGSRGTTMIVKQTRDPQCPMHDPVGTVNRVDVGSRDTFRELRSALPKGAVPLAWSPVQKHVECPGCAFKEISWRLPENRPCPQCGEALRSRTTLELDEVPGTLKLAHLGIPPREILAVRMQEGEGVQWFELKD